MPMSPAETPSEPDDLLDLSRINFRAVYRDWVRSLMERYPLDEAMRQAVGGEFESFGILQRELLVQYGLKRDGYLIDVGCGSGRLASALVEYLKGKYLGIDLVPELLDYARSLCNRADWRFEVGEGLTIPEEDGAADIVSFFSVLTHLLHEHSYLYLEEARRVLRPGGRVVFTFLDFAVPNHWAVFETSLANLGAQPLSQFVSRDGIAAWASHLDFDIEAIHDGDKPHIPLPHPVTTDQGIVMEGMGNLGQSVCVLRRR
jgi:ubiquinone/menaquinone biosynthesis C-methylase UbiE